MDDTTRQPDFRRRVPEGDNLPRLVCYECGWVHYDNPRVVVAAVATWGERILLARRAIEPREGFWTVPGGFMELGESAERGAAREVVEETGADVQVNDLLAVYSVPHIGQVHLVYRATMRSEGLQAGSESHEVRLFTAEEIPWSDLAFPTNTWALRHFLQARGSAVIAPFTNPEV